MWWIKLGIVPERIEAGHPEQNGRHERMHLTLEQETAQPPAANRRAQQRTFDRFVKEFNEVRPHEALGMQTPAAVYQRSPRKFPTRLPEVEYPDSMLVRNIGHKGQMQWKKHEVFVSQVLWVSESVCCRSMIAATGCILPRFFWPCLTVIMAICCLYPPGKATLLTLQGRRCFPFPCTPFPQPSGAESVRYVPGLNCQVCARPDNLPRCRIALESKRMENQTNT